MTEPAKPHDRFPLDWPIHRQRTPPGQRRRSKFKQSFGSSRDKLLNELKLFSTRDVVLSTNIALRLDGLPYANEREPADPGVAVWFQRKGKPYVLACDTYVHAWENVYALARVIECFRQMERDGSPALAEQAFTGFKALPPALITAPPEEWWSVLGVSAFESTDRVLAAFERKALEAHPDRGGDHLRMTRLNVARDAFKRERGL